MKYQIAAFVLDTRARTLTRHDNVVHIRPKTLALLLYLARHKEQIVSKQTLLEQIWHDVNVDEGVVFQSVREIRQLLDDPFIVQNHPRQGYQFTGSFAVLPPHAALLPTLLPKPWQQFWQRGAVLGGIILLLVIVSIRQVNAPNKTSDEISYEQSVLVLPVKNQVHYGQHDWLYLGAMEQLIGKLQGLNNAIYVHHGDYVLRLMHQVGLPRTFSTDDITQRFRAMGTNFIVETEVHGNVSDYKLIYRFHRSHKVEQGVILASSVEAGLIALAEKVAEAFDSSLTKIHYPLSKEFGDALFAQAMISYEQDWETAISFFESYLTLQPQSVMAMIYLSKLYLWQDNPEAAAALIAQFDDLAKDHTQDNSNALSQAQHQNASAHVSLIKGRIAAAGQDYQQARQHYESAATLLKQSQDWFLRATIAEEQGHAWLAQDKLTMAFNAFNEALQYYAIIQAPIGIYSSNLHLANIELAQGNTAQAQARFAATKKAIEDNQLVFLYSMLQEYAGRFNAG